MFSAAGKRGLILGDPQSNVGDLQKNPALMSVDGLWWNGSVLPDGLWRSLQPKVGIVGGGRLQFENRQRFEQLGSALYWTEEVGAVEWTPNRVTLLQR